MLRLLLIIVWLLPTVALAAVAPTGHLRVTVLPFETHFAELKPYEEGMMDSLIDGLKHVPQFIMVDRGRIQRVIKEQAFAQTGFVDPGSAVKLGKLLQAQVIISGSMQQAGSQIRINADFVDVETGQIQETHQVTGTLDNIFDLQDQLAALFIHDQQVTVTPLQQQQVTRVLKSTTNRQAYDYYLRGRKAYLLFTLPGYKEALGWYRKAIAADPRYALAYAARVETLLAEAYFREQTSVPVQDDYQQAALAAEQALALDPNLGEVHRAAGVVDQKLGKPGFEAEERRAVALNPNDGEAWLDLCVATGNSHNPDHEYLRKAVALSPDNANVQGALAWAYMAANRYREAADAFAISLQLSPTSPGGHNAYGNALAKLGRYQEAIPQFQEALRLSPRFFFAYYCYAQVLIATGKPAAAAALYTRYLQLVPDAPNKDEVQGWIRNLQ